MNITKFINGINFKQIADGVVDIDVYEIDNIKSGSVIWCKTDFLDKLFADLNNRSESFILITHCSDHPITQEVFSRRPNCIKKWYAQNVDFKHKDLIPLPIGIENHSGKERGKWTDYNFLETIEWKAEKINKIVNKFYCNFSLHTHYNRSNVLGKLINKDLAAVSTQKPYRDYFSDLKQFLFIASPRGNGIDCHRTWDALYAGSIPVVEKHIIYDSFNQYPIIQIDSWDSLSYDSFLKKYVNEFKEKKIEINYNMLNIEYWFNIIKKEANEYRAN
jgi:hypothetical protein